MLKNIFATILLASLSITAVVHAQSTADALRQSNTTFGGTARGMGVAGSFGALGGDFTATSINPAGIGIYRSSEIVVTPSLHFSKTKTDYLGSMSTDNRNSFNLGNIGLVFARLSKNREGKDWVTVNFGIGSNRIANFNQSRLLNGYNTSNSLTAYYAQRADGVLGADLADQEQNQYIENLAYQTDLILPLSPDSANKEYVGMAHNGMVQQRELLTTKGGIDEINFSVGANYKNRLYLGAAIGVPSSRYDSETLYTEEDTNDSIPDFISFRVVDYLKATGAGINGKFGVIYRFHENFRGGLSVHTPTLYNMDEEFSSFIRSEFELDPTTLEAASPSGFNSYRLRTPMKLEASVAAVSKRGFVSVDYEWVPHNQTAYSASGEFGNDPDVTTFYSNLNAAIDSTFKASHNIRVGGEAVLDKFRLRAGYAFYSSPYQNGNANQRQSITGGFGYRAEKFFIDFAYAHSFGERYYQPYTLNDKLVSAAKIDESAGNWLTTVGFKF